MSGDSDPGERQPPVVPGYRTLGVLGRGPSGTVYRAQAAATGREVAIKVFDRALDEGERAEFDRLARAAASLSSHPGIVTVLGSGTASDGRPYVVSDLLVRGSLAARIARTGPLAPGVAAALGVEVLEALEAAHAAGLAHGGVSPDNVLVSRYGRPLLADLRLLDRDGLTPAGDLRAVAALVTGAAASVPPPLATVLGRARSGGFASAGAFGAALTAASEVAPEPDGAPRLMPMPGTDPLTGPLIVTDPATSVPRVVVPPEVAPAPPAEPLPAFAPAHRLEATAATAAPAVPAGEDEPGGQRGRLLWLVPAALVLLIVGGTGAAMALAAYHHRDRPVHGVAGPAVTRTTTAATESPSVAPSVAATPSRHRRRHRHPVAPSPVATTTEAPVVPTHSATHRPTRHATAASTHKRHHRRHRRRHRATQASATVSPTATATATATHHRRRHRRR